LVGWFLVAGPCGFLDLGLVESILEEEKRRKKEEKKKEIWKSPTSSSSYDDLRRS